MMTRNKKYNFHWGHGLFVFFVFYISYLVFIVFQSRKVEHHLVMDNYYNFDLSYQQHYDEIANRKLLDQDLEFVYDKNSKSIILNFGESQEIRSARLSFYRPSDASLDFNLELHDIKDSVAIPTSNMKNGKWALHVSWDDGKQQYFKSHELVIVPS